MGAEKFVTYKYERFHIQPMYNKNHNTPTGALANPQNLDLNKNLNLTIFKKLKSKFVIDIWTIEIWKFGIWKFVILEFEIWNFAI